MWNDPIVQEVREAAERLAQDAGYDLHRFCERIREHQTRFVDRLVTLPPRRLSVPTSEELGAGGKS